MSVFNFRHCVTVKPLNDAGSPHSATWLYCNRRQKNLHAGATARHAEEPLHSTTSVCGQYDQCDNTKNERCEYVGCDVDAKINQRALKLTQYAPAPDVKAHGAPRQSYTVDRT